MLNVWNAFNLHPQARLLWLWSTRSPAWLLFYSPRGSFWFAVMTLRLLFVTLCTPLYSPNLLSALLCAYITRRLALLNFTICYPHLTVHNLILTWLDSGLFTWVIHALLDLIDCIDFYLFTYWFCILSHTDITYFYRDLLQTLDLLWYVYSVQTETENLSLRRLNTPTWGVRQTSRDLP